MTMKVLSGAATDALTNCYIKDHLIPSLHELKEEFEFTKRPFTILMLDVDHFKSFNDKHGHLHGDEVLKYFSSSLHLNLVDQENVPFRFGGDEFVLVFPGQASAYCYNLAVGLQENIKSRLFLLKGKQYLMSFSAGIATFPDDAKTPEELIHKADQALYCSKRNGRGRTTEYNQIIIERIKHFALVAGLLGMIGLGGYFYREDISAVIDRLRLMRITVRSVAAPSAKISSPALPKAAKKPTPPPSAREQDFDEVYLKSGEVLIGQIVLEAAEEVYVNLKRGRGEGMLAVKRSDILKIRKAEVA